MPNAAFWNEVGAIVVALLIVDICHWVIAQLQK